jgi:hypothetical protein
MERRKKSAAKSSGIPADYSKMVSEVLGSNFDHGLKKIQKLKGAKARFEVTGAIYLDEVVLAATLLIGKELAATTVYASIDYDPRASVPQIQDLLSACVDAVGNVFYPLLNSDKKGQLERLVDQSLSALDSVPFEWTEMPVERFIMTPNESKPKRKSITRPRSSLSLGIKLRSLGVGGHSTS